MKISSMRFAGIVLAMVLFSTLALHASVSAAGGRPGSLAFYTDPGSGALLWQILATSGLMASFYFGRASRWLKSLLSPEKQKAVDRPESQS